MTTEVVIGPETTEVVVVDNVNNSVVVATEKATEVATLVEQGPAGPPGPQGPQGPAGAAVTTLTLTAGETLGGQRVVYVENGSAFYADSSDVADVGKVTGITTGAANSGDQVTVQVGGEMAEAGWAWVPGPIYFTSTATLTQTIPATGFIQRVATTVSATKILISVGTPTLLA